MMLDIVFKVVALHGRLSSEDLTFDPSLMEKRLMWKEEIRRHM
jgi:hypothetical protein